MKPAVDRTHCNISTAAAGPRHSGGSAGAMQMRAYPLHDWAIIGVLTSHHAPFPVFPRACVSSGANRIHDTAHSCTVHMHAWEPEYPRFCSSLPVCCSSDGVDSTNCLSILKKVQYAAPNVLERGSDRISRLITFLHTLENNTCFYLRFLIWGFAHTHVPRIYYPRQSAETQTDAHTAEEMVERWPRCSLNNEARRTSTG